MLIEIKPYLTKNTLMKLNILERHQKQSEKSDIWKTYFTITINLFLLKTLVSSM